MRNFQILISLLFVACNRPEQTSNEQMSGGTVVAVNPGKDHPANYTVALSNNLGIFCSGALIHPRIVLTAAHCEISPGNIAERLDPLGKYEGRTVTQVINNETYLKTNIQSESRNLRTSSDFSLLLLDRNYSNVAQILPQREPAYNRPILQWH